LEVKDAEDVFRAAFALEHFRHQLMGSSHTVGHELNVTADFFTAAATKIRRLQRKP